MRRVMVTGSVQRVGLEIALWFARQGWDVALHCRRKDARAEAAHASVAAEGARVVMVEGDLEAEDAGRCVTQAAEALGGLEALVNNAAIFERGDLADVTRAQFDRHMHVNLWSPLALTRAFAALGTPGSVIHLADATWAWSLAPAFSAYALSKMGLWNLTLLQAKAYAPRLRVNAVGLGPTLAREGEEALFEKIAAAAPSGCVSSVEEVCAALRFLLDSPSLTGRFIGLNGAFSAPF